MTLTAFISRRQALQRSFLLPIVAGVSFAATSAEPTAAGRSATVLVAYFTRTGNTRLIATQVARALDATLFQIVPAAAYPEDYEAQVAQAEDERQRGYEPPLQAMVPDLDSYETVFLGFPIWGMTAPSVIRSFLSQHDLSGKTLVPFITHGGYGLGNSLAVIAEHAPDARLIDGFSKQCDQERETLREVTRWLESVEIGR
ncbi:flavodoxin [Mesorhizobium escarrei]|uniref:Flavodoxin n=1 Tax=Mesorhizobium escarrei TaxID=666018 RepID=A0ABN8K8Y0_9HYPH|nr:flavodoxin [Mesorhizobium escarrei]CAH2405876.1 Flavodoxin [Mesorhizobium escarrei]